MTSILIIDDHKAVADGTSRLLRDVNFDVKLLYSTDQLEKTLNEFQFDLFLIDWSMPGVNGIETVQTIFNSNFESKIVIYTGFELEIIPVLDELSEHSVFGMISKSAGVRTLLSGINSVLNGYEVFPHAVAKEIRKRRVLVKETEEQFDTREQEIIKAVVAGKTNGQIADQLFVNQRTVGYMLSKIYQKLSVHSREEVEEKVKKLGLILN
jgi:two-component system competent response regulator ComA